MKIYMRICHPVKKGALLHNLARIIVFLAFLRGWFSNPRAEFRPSH